MSKKSCLTKCKELCFLSSKHRSSLNLSEYIHVHMHTLKQRNNDVQQNIVVDSKYVIVSKIGYGSFSNVYKAYDIENENNVAIKIFHNAVRKKMIYNEIEYLSCLSKCNRVSQMIDYSKSFDSEYIVTDFSEYGDLFEYMDKTYYGKRNNRYKYMPIRTIKLLSWEIIKSIEYMHSKNILHNDLKLENILLFGNLKDDDVRIKLTDFGLSSVLTTKNSKTKEMNGTLAYLPPEYLLFRIRNKKSDLWAFGCIVFILLHNYHPISNEDISYNEMKNIVINIDTKDLMNNCERKMCEDSKDLLYKLLEVDYYKRIDLKDVLDHKWFNEIK